MARRPKGDLIAWWGRDSRGNSEDLMFAWDKQGCDGRLLYYYFACKMPKWDGRPEERSLAEELEARGYDLKTLKFSIKRKKETL